MSEVYLDTAFARRRESTGQGVGEINPDWEISMKALSLNEEHLQRNGSEHFYC